MEECIFIDGLELLSHLGATAAERSAPQRLTANLHLYPARGLNNLGDDLDRTVDYSAASAVTRTHAAKGERVLVETLAEELAQLLLERFPLRVVEIELRKYILPCAASAGVRLRREAKAEAVQN